jgi:prevent-host-death family protein
MDPVGVEAARRRLPELLDRAAAGERTVISRHGHPVAALVPVSAPTPASTSATATPTASEHPQRSKQRKLQTLLNLQGSGRRCWSLYPQQAAQPASPQHTLVQPLPRQQAFAPHQLHQGARVALDGAALVAFLCDAKGTGNYLGPLLQGIAQGHWHGLISSLSLAHVLDGPLSQGQEELAQRYARVFSDAELWTVVPPDAAIVEAAVRLRCRAAGAISVTAAIELATAIQGQAAVLVTDNPHLAQTEHLPVLSALRP